ncbi:Aldehyde dehydrogenase [Chondrus crispus]|uniref:Aldehyde dehydrogenase n=1 Tax=Chondrus crispus TaxID=2769 RepID=R7QAN8_CHOCR|nr:Aldehyde dehydrogenase [Chondrus crispus]CDF35134.1 Aldehyde dehydrogenase [Chondrus crispus]|eukprot:XP_005714953.1 Aldehyde dehydrogenase [Chondrus crispus]
MDKVCNACEPFLPGLTKSLSSFLSSLESNLAILLTASATNLHGLSLYLSSAPFSSNLNSFSTRFNLWYTTLGDHLFIPLAIFFSFLVAVSLFLLFTFLAHLYVGVDPILVEFPLPSPSYDPYADEQSNSFSDPDVCPQLVAESSDQTLHAVNPSTGETLGYVPVHSTEAVDEAVSRAREVQPIWAATTFAQRRSVMRVLLNHILHEQKRLCEISRRDSGKTLLDASLGEIIPTMEKLRWVIAEGENALVPDRRTVGPMTIHKKATVEYMPLGVIAAIAPWNYPLHNLMNPVIASLFAGNAVVVKPSEHTSWSSLYFARLVRRALALCGHSPELMQLVVGDGVVGQALVNADIDKLFFTGSTIIGRKVALAAAKRLLPVVLELGGKDPFIVCDDANVKHAATICLRGVFQNAGQNCIAVERVFVHEVVMDEFAGHVVAGAKAIRLGVDMGAMTMGESALAHVKDLVDDAVKQGAELLVGGKAAKVNGKGSFFEATVLKGVTPRMRIAKEEVFGPVVSLIAWSNDNVLVKMVNSCPFGLGSSVYSEDSGRADTILSAIRVGMGNVNDFATNYLCQSMPFGGTKESGSDKFAGIEGLRGCCIAKAVTRDRFPGVKTTLPKAFQYPTRPNAFEISAEITDLVYGKGILVKFDNVRNLLGMTIRRGWRPRTTASG